MKTWMKWASVAAAGAVIVSGVAISRASVVGTAHDFVNGYGSWSNPGKTRCEVCHVPHNAKADQLIPLWGHETTVASYQMYTSATMNATIPAGPSGASKACLSCHDGTVAVNAYNGATNGVTISGSGLLSTDLRNDHPISIDYQDSSGGNPDPYIKARSTATVIGGTVASALLSNGKVECASCHDVHREIGDSGSDSAMLKISNTLHPGSQLCLSCHDK